MTIPELVRQAAAMDPDIVILVQDATVFASQGDKPPAVSRTVWAEVKRRGREGSHEKIGITVSGASVMALEIGPTVTWHQAWALERAFREGVGRFEETG